ncbi:GDSL-type esterase/lipase family protein [Halpernia frigidisoli]|uniref:Lysophospholipase L1 n=1 Tax=Halpernia frigidisoli TaxID=1125876 RepID=A0A1I3DS92_9FLAO|nr:GDSL-type esterase/lipase family protein [Halpernia frigidisoli]SFH89572.1 Lysophospholipase L1 [Halpernia frigidisoli]
MKKLIFLFLLLSSIIYNAQEKHAFTDEIQNFKTLDAQNPPPKNAILLIGSSSFRKWTNVSDYFPTKTIINRGFGGSTLLDLNYFADDLVKPYDPKQILIYCGENDFAADENVTSTEVFNRFKNFYKKIRQYYPKIEVDFVSIKNSPSRTKYWNKMLKTNALIKNFLNKEKNSKYIDITNAMTDSNGKVRKELFLEDMLHMKSEGYKLWAKKIEPYLK